MCRTSIDRFLLRKEGGQLTNEELVSLIQQGENVSENMGILYQQNYYLIRNIVYTLSECAEIDDLMQEAYFGIVDAVDHYDPSFGTKFMSYATYRIRMHCIRYIENHGRTKRIPVHLLQKIRNYQKLIAEYGGDVDADTVKEELHLTQEQYDLMMQTIMTNDCVSLDSIVAGTEDITVGDSIPDDIDIEQDAVEKVMCDQLWNQVNTLDDRKKAVILKRYKEGETIDSIANEFQVSNTRIRQLEKKALEQLKQLEGIHELSEVFGYDCSIAYKSGLQAMKDGKGSTVEYLVIKQMELQERHEATLKRLRETIQKM